MRSLLIFRATAAACALLTACPPTWAQDRAAIEAGEQLYDEHCANCHGEKLRATGSASDLRTLPADARARFDQAVLNGKGQMPPWQGTLNEEELDQLWAYIRSRAR